MDWTVRNNPDRSRFELVSSDDHVAGQLVYEDRGGTLVLVHTEIEDGHAGEGLGSRLVRGALDTFAQSGRPVLAECEFVQAYVKRHEEYAERVELAG